MLDETLELNGVPRYEEPILYLQMMGRPLAWEFNGWKAESLSWKHSCYIHTGLSGPMYVFEGPDVREFWESIATNSFAQFSVGSMKHAVMCNEQGLVASHGILQRHDEHEYRHFASGPWAAYMLAKSNFDVTVRPVMIYLTQVAGPKSLEVLERATGESLSDVGFLRFRNTKIDGKTVEIGRIGMSGNLAFEVRGPLAQGPDVYDAIYRAGRDLGIERLGWRTYLVNHVEGGFPQQTWTFLGAAFDEREFIAFNAELGVSIPIAVTGSVDPDNTRARQRTPLEIGWDRAVRFDHEFIGRKALEQEAAHPRRQTVTLRWNPEDVIDIYASLFQKGEEYRTIDLPYFPPRNAGFAAHADHVLKDGRDIGVSAGVIYSYYFREQLSMATIDIAEAEIGNEVIVQWGDYGRRIKNVRATVERFPYLDEGRNDAIDLATLSANEPGVRTTKGALAAP